MKFKYGDKVRIIGPKPNQVWPAMPKEMNMTIGLIGTVKGVNAKARAYYVETYNPQNMFYSRLWYDEEWLAPVEEKKKSPSKADLFASLLVTLDDVAKNPKPYPKRIYKGDGKTVVMWEDGTKTIVKRAEGEPDNDYAAFTAALAIKVYGDNSKVNRIVRMTETVEKRKKKKTQKEDIEGKFEVTRLAGEENKFESAAATFHSIEDAEKFAAFLNSATSPGKRYFVRERERSHATEEEQ